MRRAIDSYLSLILLIISYSLFANDKINQGPAGSLYRNIKQIGFDLPLAIQNKNVSKVAKGLVSTLAILVVSGCVSQQSALDFSGQEIAQPVATGVSLSGAPISDTNTAALTTSNNIPVKAPRPATTVAQANVVAPQLQTSQISSEVDTTLSVSQLPEQAPTGNVIDGVFQPTINQTAVAQVAAPVPTSVTSSVPTPQNTIQSVATPEPTAAIPTQIPATTQQTATTTIQTNQESVEIASLSPTVAVNEPVIHRTSRTSSRIYNSHSLGERPSRKITKPKVQKPKTIVATARTTTDRNTSDLPGVKSNSEIFGIKNENPDASNVNQPTQVAALGSLGRISPNGLRVQHSNVQVSCLKPGVLQILKQVERRYGKKPIITSGYRSPKGNRSAGGARNSQHIFCKAVDIQVEGVSKWNLAKYLRTIPGRGGVGTYCRTQSVHFDIGSKRDWHHPCRNSAKRKRKKT